MPGQEKVEMQWMPRPEESAPSNCPQGLEYLLLIDQLLVHQKIELLELMTGFETENKYVVKNSLGQQVYYAKEVSDCATRQCCGPNRPFQMQITDNAGKEVMRLDRPFRCGFQCCCETQRPFLEVQAPPGNPIGYVKSEACACVWPTFLLLDLNMQPILRIHTPCCGVGCCDCSPKYPVRSMDGQDVGLIQKQWSGLTKEMFTDADNFGVSFPMDLDVKMKGVMLGALFLIDFLFFETQKQNH
ncbi:phospholipid scramblase 1-like [Sycon ciliatum]|uniref:phospholipid scramblase 1-like n=1 Tax=Sycon ciliatum TaxID=27933 RepID=UPI0020ACF445|eukprot:scpid76951/ scgid15464/ Phospholipid scramblase 2; Ca(2+)-dependent phospholipid scramblase 2